MDAVGGWTVHHRDEIEQLGKEARRVRLWAALAIALLILVAAPALALVGLPLNDDFGNAAKLKGAHASALGTNVLATRQPGEPGSAGGASVWYSWTPDRSGPAQVNTCSKATTFNTLVAVYTRSGAVPPFSNLNMVAGNDDHPGGACSTNRSLVDFDVKGGTTYHVAVDGVGGATGAFELNVGEVFGYAGRTSQGHAIRFRVSNDRKRVAGMKVRLTATCRLTGIGSSTTDTFPLGGLPKFRLRHGEFGRTLARTREGVYEAKRVRGARSGRAFKGTVRYETSSLGGSCDSRKVGWTARPEPLAGLG
jgi:hypothetical protein